jgi:hypothetical protein
LIVTDLSTFSGEGPWAAAVKEIKLSAINARNFFIHFSPNFSVMRGLIQKQQRIINDKLCL